MFLNVENHIQIARRATIGRRLAFAGDAEARAGVHPGRNTQVDRFFALYAALTVAVRAAFAHDFPRALARGACARNGEETLLVGKLAAAAARLASYDASPFFGPSAIADFAVFLAGQLDFSGDTRGGFFKGQRHVIAEIGAALLTTARTATARASTEEIFEAEEIAQNVMEIAEDGAIEVHSAAGAGEAGVAVGVVDFTLLLIAQHAVSFRALTELYFGFFLVFRIAVRVPL
jgi:hypothetical protein